MKYAILEHGGKQYVAEEGSHIEVDRVALDEGKPIEFKQILLINDGRKIQVGSPYVSGVSVKGKVLEHFKGKKITVFKFKPKQRYRKTQGHRQVSTRVSIEKIALPSASKTKSSTESKKKKTKKE